MARGDLKAGQAEQELPERIKTILLEADASMMRLVGESHHYLYQFLRITANRIAPLDAFYIGFYSENNMAVFPYSFDGQEYYDPNKFAYPPGGLSAWILKNKKPYWFKQDGGALLNKGKTFGQLEKKSQDAVVVPILEPCGKRGTQVIGVISMQSYKPNSYDAITIQALEWLARSLVLVQQREREDKVRRQLLSNDEPVIVDPMLRPNNVVNQMLDKMQSIRRKAEGLKSLLSDRDPQLALAVDELIEECHRRQTETIEIFLQAIAMEDTPLSKLSKQEQKIVFLLAEGLSDFDEGYSNEQLSERLNTSKETIRTQLKSIYKKMGVSGRTEVIEIVQNYIPKLPRQ